jgi:hypothetical protein
VRVLELGSGNGWLAMTIVRKFCDSIDAFHATEMEAGGALDWLNLILDSNREKRKLSSKEREKIYATSLDWNEVILSDKEEEEVKDDYDAQMIDVDFLLGSDLVYDESGVKILPRVIAKLLRTRCRKTKSGFMLYAHTKHRYDGMDVDFFENLEKEGLVCEEIRNTAILWSGNKLSNGGGLGGGVFVPLFRTSSQTNPSFSKFSKKSTSIPSYLCFVCA